MPILKFIGEQFRNAFLLERHEFGLIGGIRLLKRLFQCRVLQLVDALFHRIGKDIGNLGQIPFVQSWHRFAFGHVIKHRIPHILQIAESV